MTKVLLIESNIRIRLPLRLFLTYKGYWVTSCSSTKAARDLLARNVYQLIIAGIHHQEENLFDFTRSLRTGGNYAPVIFMGERAYEEDIRRRLSGLDEYLLRPYTGAALDLVLEKALTKTRSTQRPLLYTGVMIDEAKKVLRVNEKVIPLAKMEVKILVVLARKAGKIVTLDHLYSLYDLDASLNTRVFSYVKNIRQKLEDAGVETLKINFVRDGYKLEVSA